MSEADYRQQQELEAERLTRTLEALGHIEAAGLIEEAATLRCELNIRGSQRPLPLWDGVSDPF